MKYGERSELSKLSLAELRSGWDKADQTCDEVTLTGLGSVTKGDIYAEIVKRTPKETTLPEQKRPLRRSASTFSPIDGSWGMLWPNKRGRVMIGSKR